MSEADQKMKALETETTFSSSSVKNDDTQKQKGKDIIIQNMSDQSTNQKNVNLGLSLGGVYGQSSGASPPENAGVAVVGPRPSSPSKLIASAATNPPPCREIHNTTTDNLLIFQTQAGNQVLPQSRLLVRPQFVPVRRRPARSRSLTQYARAIAQRKLQQILASTLNTGPVALSSVNSISNGAEMIMFQDTVGTNTNWNNSPVPSRINSHNSLVSPSYAEGPIPAGIEFGNRLVSNSVELSSGIILQQNGPAPFLNGTMKLIQNASGSGSNVDEFGATNFQNAAAGLDSNGESAEFAGTNFENAPLAGSGSNGPLTEYAGTMVPNDGGSGSSKVENEGGSGSRSSNEKTLEEIVAAAEEEEEEEENREAKRVKLSNEGYGDYDRRVLKKMPSVMSRGDDPNAMRIHGFLYKYKKGDVQMVCSCHGHFLTPTQFLMHAGVSDLSHPMRNIFVQPFDI